MVFDNRKPKVILPDVSYVDVLSDERRVAVLSHLLFCKSHFERNGLFVERVLLDKLINAYKVLKSRISQI